MILVAKVCMLNVDERKPCGGDVDGFSRSVFGGMILDAKVCMLNVPRWSGGDVDGDARSVCGGMMCFVFCGTVRSLPEKLDFVSMYVYYKIRAYVPGFVFSGAAFFWWCVQPNFLPQAGIDCFTSMRGSRDG